MTRDARALFNADHAHEANVPRSSTEDFACKELRPSSELEEWHDVLGEAK